MVQITKDNAYDAAAPDDFPAMLDVERYGKRSTAFDKIISATHDHFWDPLDKKYIDFAAPFDMTQETILPEEFFAIFHTRLGDTMTKEQRVKFANEAARWQLSALLHGEQGALALSASLCHILKDPGAQEYAANQTREEARHVTAFAAYIKARWGTPLPCGETLKNLLTEMVGAPEVYKKIVGMQMLVEGLAMGAFATLYQKSQDPLLRKLCQLVMTDEAFHHKFGKIWADRTIPQLSEDEHNLVEDWAAQCFQTLLFNLVNSEQMKVVYDACGIDALERRHHHRPHQGVLRHVCEHGRAEGRGRAHGRRRHRRGRHPLPPEHQLRRHRQEPGPAGGGVKPPAPCGRVEKCSSRFSGRGRI
jgi:hypothetical protein